MSISTDVELTVITATTETETVNATAVDLIKIVENSANSTVGVTCQYTLSDSTTTTKNYTIASDNYTLLMSANPSWATGKPANEWRKEDVWFLITYMDAGAPALWVASTAYAANDVAYYGKNVYTCTTAGTSGTTAPTATSGTATDGTVTWTWKQSLGS
ncbi:MAG: hypothetical protein H6Q67_1956 [Firmicutes bacterium]|nr:hypothetical protein [Bacillota bacterium]